MDRNVTQDYTRYGPNFAAGYFYRTSACFVMVSVSITSGSEPQPLSGSPCVPP